MLIKDLIKAKKLPRFIASNKKFLACKDIKKIFPSIGLPNCSDTCKINNRDDIERKALALISVFASMVGDMADTALGLQGREEYQALAHAFNAVYTNFITWNNGQVSLKLIDDVIVNDKVIYKAGTTLFSVFSSLARKYDHFDAPDHLASAKAFNAVNIPNTDMTVAFSSDGTDGLWDIATMSMRGFRSCQSWDGQHKAKLIGSLVDPFMGVIYITSGANTNYGTKMLNRSVVRYVVSAEEKKPYLLIDKMYPAYSDAAFGIFKEFLSTRTGLEVVYGPNIYAEERERVYIPTSHNIETLSKRTLSYRDTAINYGAPKKDIQKAYKVRLTSVQNLFGNTALIKSNQNDSIFGRKDAIGLFLKDITNLPDFKYYLKSTYRDLALAIGSSIDIQSYTNPNDYKKAILYAFFNSSFKTIQKKLITKFVGQMNRYYVPYCKQHNIRLRSSHIQYLIEDIDKALAKTIKAELTALIVKAKSVPSPHPLTF